MSQRSLLIAAVATASTIVAGSVWAGEQVNYLQQIKPILAKRCYACHGALKQEAGLRLDTAALAIRGGDSGPVIIPGDAKASVLIQRVTASDESERMPPIGEPLQPDQIATLRSWIAQKAVATTGRFAPLYDHRCRRLLMQSGSGIPSMHLLLGSMSRLD
jgi:mono/diheme cytochrome c family protein